MNRSNIVVWPAGLVCLAIGIAACGTAESSRGADKGSRSSLALTGDAALQCPRDAEGGVASADECVGGGSARVLVHVNDSGTCSTVLDTVTALVPDAQAYYQFPDAPSAVRDHYCIIESASEDVSTVTPIVSNLCNDSSIALVVHDCSTAPFSAPTGTNARVPSARASSGPTIQSNVILQPPGSTVQDGQGGCDTCAAVFSNKLYVTLPLSMTGNGTATMTVRFLASPAPDKAIIPPAGAQAFTVSDIGSDDTTAVRLYNPGEVAPAK